ncbi:type VI secretion system tip protein VgrG [Vibrio aquaticus]|uniref:Type VI secretion system tip protein VgrG n=1 Tax=Vibrio aquaticus TaxID=2496559 RepID=A0A432D2E6_9VIBR|nr:type VI secretion system tip protein TssI/VgrG [Vibrio aquaticus]RTZ18092.1 type VI secretion system tip protein VgrG [Vibrio aquaticus]
MTTLHFTLNVEGLDQSTFVVTKFEGDEVISQQTTQSAECCNGYRYDVHLASRHPSIDPNDIIDKTAQLTLYRNNEVVKRVHGVVCNFSRGDTGHHHTVYGLTLVPALERLSLRQNSRIFQQKSVPEIISILLKEMKVEDFAFSIRQEYLPREFCVQYNETDLDFVHRLLAEEGLVYSFIFTQKKHTLLFTDSSANLPSLSLSVPYNSLAGGHADESYIRSLHRSTTSQESHAILKDRFFKQPKYSFLHESIAPDTDYQRNDYEYFDAIGRFKSDPCGEKFSKVRLEYLRREASKIQGKSDVANLQAGYKFDLTAHLDNDFNTQWLLVSVHHLGEQPQALEEAAGANPTTYSNDFVAIPKHINWQGQPTTKPIMSGPLIATVVGPENEEIYCDEYGRVKVQFPWDRYSTGDEHSSCWIRVAEGWAGMMAIPRVGHEVIVEFLHGDPDQPIITGRTFHATNTPPYPLPKHKTKTIIRTETHQGEGYNELSFEDQSGKEQIFIHAQKDWDSEIKHDLTLDIQRDKHLTVSGNQYTQVQGNDHHTVEGESRSTIGKERTLIVEGELHLEAGTVWVNKSGSEVHIKAGNKVVIEAGSEITMKAAGSFLKVDPAGVHLVGNAVNLNSGGSASNGSGFSGQAVKQSRTLQNNTSINATQPIEISASKTSDSPTVVPFQANAQAESLPNTSTEKSEKQTTTSSSEKVESLRLKSALLNPSLTLDKLANRESRPYKIGASGQEVEYIQQALLKLGFDLGKFGADGDYGSTTEHQVKLFQESYTQTNQIHLAYEVGAVDGITGQGTILGLDEALIEGWEYKSTCKLMIDHQFIQQLEGSKTVGYVPDPKNSQSGVTIATGFDLGARSVTDLKNLGLPEDLINRFSPYVGLKNQPAIEKLNALPLSITTEELEVVNELVKKSETNKLVKMYNSSSSTIEFECLPKEAQTVIASVAYQYGYLPRRTTAFWKQSITQDWLSMYNNLMDFKDSYPTRRKKEASLIKELI